MTLKTARVGAFISEETDQRCELDSHADTCVGGTSSVLVTRDYERPVRVFGYSSDVGEADPCKTISGAMAYDDPMTGQTYMLVVNQMVLVDRMDQVLLSTMQMRDNDIRVNDEPKHMTNQPTEHHHALTVQMEDEESLIIPLSFKGTVSYFPTRKPTVEEYEATDPSMIIHLTQEELEWDPNDDKFETAEQSMLDHNYRLAEDYRPKYDRVISAIRGVYGDMPVDEELSVALSATVTIPYDMDERRISAVKSGKRQKAVGIADIARRLNITLDAARKVYESTEQKGVRNVLHPFLSRRFRTNDRQLRYNRLPCPLYMDTMFVDEKARPSWYRRNTMAQVFAAANGWCRVHPMNAKSQVGDALKLLCQRDGVPPTLIFDNSLEQLKSTSQKVCKEFGIKRKTIEPHSPWQNYAEGVIRELKRGAIRKQALTGSPAKLWDHVLELEAYIRSFTVRDNFANQGQVPETIMFGETPDISPFIECGWYDFVWYWDNQATFPKPKEQLGRWLGPSLDVGPAMSAKILKTNGQPVTRSTYRPVSQKELRTPVIQKLCKEFDEAIEESVGTTLYTRPAKRSKTGKSEVKIETVDDEYDDDDGPLGFGDTPKYELYADDVEGKYEHTLDADDHTPETIDKYVNAVVDLPTKHGKRSGKVVRNLLDEHGQVIGDANDNPILDTRMYMVEFPDGSVAPYAANKIAENMISMCDIDGNQVRLMEGITGHKFDKDAIPDNEGTVKANDKIHRVITTKGVMLTVLWKNGETSWEKLSDMKDSYPIEVAEYAVAHGIEKKPAFAWWVPYTLKKRKAIIKQVRARFVKRTHKFGIEIPSDYNNAVELDKKNGNTLWQEGTKKEMDAVRIAFKVLDNDEEILPGYQYAGTHLVYDVRLDGFRRKARLVGEGCSVAAPTVLTYASVVSRETVRIALTIAALNDLEVKSSDIANAYLTTPCEEKIWTKLGPEFGNDKGKRAYIVRALYGLAASGASFSRHIADCMSHLGYSPCKADPDLWMREAIRPDDKFRYYEYVLLYVDDALAIGHDPIEQLNQLDKYFMMKKGSIGDPDVYLGGKLRKVTLDNGVVAWSYCPSKYVQEAVSNVERYLKENHKGRKLKRKVNDPWPYKYDELEDESPELNPKDGQFYQSQIGVLQWALEIGRVDCITQISKLASMLAQPREGHLEALIHVFAYLKNRHNSRMVFDPTYAGIKLDDFPERSWTRYYGDVKEALPPNAPEPLGKEVEFRGYSDSDFAADKVRRRSRTGYYIFLNSALIAWMSKKQPCVETSVFGAEFVAMKHLVEALRGLRYKLRMMGVPIAGPSYIRGDNLSVVTNSSKPESVLKRKSNSVAFHFVRESCAMGESMIGHISSRENPADLATKVNHPTTVRERLVDMILYNVYDAA